MESKIIRSDFEPLNRFVNSLANAHNHVAKIGIFGNKTSRTKDRQTNAEIGAIHEFGSFSLGIPARSFLLMPIRHEGKQIVKDAEQGAVSLMRDGKWTIILRNLGLACENAIQRAFETRGFGKWKPNSPVTIRRKGSSAPLIDTAQLRRSIASKVE